MTMLTSTPAGDAYTLSELQAMYSDAGFGASPRTPSPESPHGCHGRRLRSCFEKVAADVTRL